MLGKLIVIGILLCSVRSAADCPDMNGHWTYSLGPLAAADMMIVEPDCTQADIKMVQRILTTTTRMFFNGPLDGVKRPQQPAGPNETDLGSAQFIDGVGVIFVDQYFNDGKLLQTKVEAKLLSAEKLNVTQSNIDQQGNLTGTKTVTFSKAQAR